MKDYNYKNYLSNLFILSSLLFSISFILQVLIGHYEVAILLCLCVVLHLLNAYMYRKPYLTLGEDKLCIGTGAFKKEIMIKDIISSDEEDKFLKVTYNKGDSIKKQKIGLSYLKYSDKKQFLNDFRNM